MKNLFLTALVVAILTMPLLGQARNNITFNGDFEQPLLNQYSGVDAAWHELLMANSPHPTRVPGTSLRAQINSNEYDVGGNRWRAQMVHDGLRTTSVNNNIFFMGGDPGSGIQHNVWRWYAFSVYVPTDWQDDSQNEEVVWALHEQPDPCENYRVGPLQLMISNGNFKWSTQYDSRPCTPADLQGVGASDFYNQPLEKGKWVDWVLQVRWDFKTVAEGGVGFIKLWKDGVEQPTYYGANCYNDQKPVYLKVGPYRWAWSNPLITNRYLYFDEVRIGQGHASYADVAPGRATIGHLDSVDEWSGAVSGWSLDPDHPEQSINIHFYIDGSFAGYANANIPRPDLLPATGFAGDHGYNFTIPSQYLDGSQHTIAAYGIDVNGNYNSNLIGSPYTFPASTVCNPNPGDMEFCSYNGGWWNYDGCYCQY